MLLLRCPVTNTSLYYAAVLVLQSAGAIAEPSSSNRGKQTTKIESSDQNSSEDGVSPKKIL